MKNESKNNIIFNYNYFISAILAVISVSIAIWGLPYIGFSYPLVSLSLFLASALSSIFIGFSTYQSYTSDIPAPEPSSDDRTDQSTEIPSEPMPRLIPRPMLDLESLETSEPAPSGPLPALIPITEENDDSASLEDRSFTEILPANILVNKFMTILTTAFATTTERSMTLHSFLSNAHENASYFTLLHNFVMEAPLDSQLRHAITQFPVSIYQEPTSVVLHNLFNQQVREGHFASSDRAAFNVQMSVQPVEELRNLESLFHADPEWATFIFEYAFPLLEQVRIEGSHEELSDDLTILLEELHKAILNELDIIDSEESHASPISEEITSSQFEEQILEKTEDLLLNRGHFEKNNLTDDYREVLTETVSNMSATLMNDPRPWPEPINQAAVFYEEYVTYQKTTILQELVELCENAQMTYYDRLSIEEFKNDINNFRFETFGLYTKEEIIIWILKKHLLKMIDHLIDIIYPHTLIAFDFHSSDPSFYINAMIRLNAAEENDEDLVITAKDPEESYYLKINRVMQIVTDAERLEQWTFSNGCCFGEHDSTESKQATMEYCRSNALELRNIRAQAYYRNILDLHQAIEQKFMPMHPCHERLQLISELKLLYPSMEDMDVELTTDPKRFNMSKNRQKVVTLDKSSPWFYSTNVAIITLYQHVLHRNDFADVKLSDLLNLAFCCDVKGFILGDEGIATADKLEVTTTFISELDQALTEYFETHQRDIHHPLLDFDSPENFALEFVRLYKIKIAEPAGTTMSDRSSSKFKP